MLILVAKKKAKQFAIFFAIFFLTFSHHAVAQTQFRCFVKDAVSLQDNGTLGNSPVTEILRKSLNGSVIDTFTGAITYSDGMRQLWSVVQEGRGGGNDYVLVSHKPAGDVEYIAASAATNFIRVRAWRNKPQVTFMFFSLSEFVTGTCEVL